MIFVSEWLWRFQAYVEQQLVPVLKRGDIVIKDNLGSHKSAAVRRLIKAAGARFWFLPPYSPNLNSIEQAFAKDQTLDAPSVKTNRRRHMATHRLARHDNQTK